jgi:hypothetical protein
VGVCTAVRGLCLLAASCVCAQAGQSPGQYWVSFKIVQGRLAVDRDAFCVPSSSVRFEDQIRSTVRQTIAAIPSLSPDLRVDATWPQYVNLYENWSAADSSRLDLGTLFSSDFLFANILKQTPDFGLALNDQDIDPVDGTISFSILPLFDSTAVHIRLPAMLPPRQRTRVPQLRKRLRHLNGSLWSSAAIRNAFGPLYANLGLTPQILLFPTTQTIQIIEGSRIASILLPADEVVTKDVNPLLWLLLDTRRFRRAKGKRVVDLDHDLGYTPGDEPYLVAYEIQELQLLVSPLGYTLVTQASARTGASQYVDLTVQRASSAKPKPKSRSIGAGFQYKPGQDLSALGNFSWPPLSASIGGPSGTLASGSYSVAHLAYSVSVDAGVSEERNRVLDGARLNEEIVSDSATFAWNPWRALDGNTLTFQFTPNHSTVFDQTLNTIAPGVQFLHTNLASQYPWRFSIEPRIVIDGRFAHSVLTANTHRSFDHWEYDLSGRFENAFGDLPIFELPSFGGENTVRGFRADDALGRRLWASQNELWRPLPRLSPLKLATFFDVGGAYQTSGSSPGLREGVGAGLRLDLRLAVLKFDWAYGFGPAATGGSRGKVYFDVVFPTQQ